MSRIRLLYNGDVHSGRSHWHFKAWTNDKLLGEKIILKDGEPTVIPISSDDTNLIKQLYKEIAGFEYISNPKFPSPLDLYIENDLRGSCILQKFWEQNEWISLKRLISDIIDEVGPNQI